MKIVDKYGMIIAYRLPMPPQLLTALVASSALVPEKGRGSENRFWALCMTSGSKKPMYSTDYQGEQEMAMPRFAASEALFKWLSDDVFRYINPAMYGKFMAITELLRNAGFDKLPLARAWCGLAMKRNMTGAGDPHMGSDHVPLGFQCIVPWGTFKTAKLLLWQAGLAIEYRTGDVILFCGRLFTHNADFIEGGVMHTIDVFNHLTVLDHTEGNHGSQRQRLRVEQRRSLAKKYPGRAVPNRVLKGAVSQAIRKEEEEEEEPMDQAVEEIDMELRSMEGIMG